MTCGVASDDAVVPFATIVCRRGGSRFFALSYESVASPTCRMWLAHCVRRADSRALCTAGSSRPMSVAMIAITTKSSTSVKPRRQR